jgi:hypothetical protein
MHVDDTIYLDHNNYNGKVLRQYKSFRKNICCETTVEFCLVKEVGRRSDIMLLS